MTACGVPVHACDARDEALQRYMPLVLAAASRFCRRYVSVGDDEVQIGLLALEEARQVYDPNRGRGFAGFAKLVIRRRLIDYLRIGVADRVTVPLSSLTVEDEEGGLIYPCERISAECAWQQQQERAALAEEIDTYRERLIAYGLTWRQLLQSVPSLERARRAAIHSALFIVQTPSLRSYCQARHDLPLAALAAAGFTERGRKTLERRRIYIMALVVLLLSPDLPRLRSYLPRAIPAGARPECGPAVRI